LFCGLQVSESQPDDTRVLKVAGYFADLPGKYHLLLAFDAVNGPSQHGVDVP
jgi:hypothetical protein